MMGSQMVRQTRRTLLTTLAGGGLAITAGQGFRSAQAQGQDVIRLGASLSLTGRLSTEGRLVRDGYDFAVRHINQRGGLELGGKKYQFEIKYYDDESDTNTAVRLTERLIVEDKIPLLLGPYSSGATVATSTVAERHNVPMVAAHAAATSIYERGYKNIFATLNTVDQYTLNLIKLAAEQSPKPKTLALIHENALFPQLGIEAAARQARDHGLEVVYMEKYPTGNRDFSPMLAAVRGRNPDLFLVAGYTQDMILLTKQARELNLRPKMMGFLLGPTLPGFVDSLKEAAENVVEPVQWTPSSDAKDDHLGYTAKEFAELFKKEAGYDPDYHPPQSAAAVLVYYHAIRKAGSLEPQAVRNAIAQTNIQTFYGGVRFNEKGQNVAKGMSVIQIQNGKPALVYPTGGAAVKFNFPAN
jgi:branched-chain amino acid transport system substrate-binding protein